MYNARNGTLKSVSVKIKRKNHCQKLKLTLGLLEGKSPQDFLSSQNFKLLT